VDFHRDKLTLASGTWRGAAGLPVRREQHLPVRDQPARTCTCQWLESAIVELEGTPDTVAEPPLTRLVWNREHRAAGAQDARDTEASSSGWRARPR
jgi:hypothetical protein